MLSFLNLLSIETSQCGGSLNYNIPVSDESIYIMIRTHSHTGENAPLLLFTLVYFFFFYSSFLFSFFFSFLFLLVIYVHSLVSCSVVIVVSIFSVQVYTLTRNARVGSDIWPHWIHFTRVTCYMHETLLN